MYACEVHVSIAYMIYAFTCIDDCVQDAFDYMVATRPSLKGLFYEVTM